MRVQAVLVDGAGHTKELVFERTHPIVRVPIPADGNRLAAAESMVAFSDVTFDRLGTLPDGRVVYGMAGVGWQLWALKVDMSRDIPEPQRQRLWDHDIDQAIEHLGARRPIRVYDVVHENKRESIDEREVWGVGIPSEPS